HREATRLRAALQHLHRLTAKTSVSRNPMVKVLKKLYVHFRSKGSDVGDLGHDALEDIENDQGEELVIENMDDEPIIISIKDLPSPGEGIAMKAEDVEAIEDTKDKPEVVTERAQATEDIESKPELVTERAQAAEEIESKVPVAVEMAQAAEDIERKPEVIEMAQAAEDTESKPVVGIEMAQAVEDIKSKPPVASEMVQALELIEDSQMPFQAVERDVVLVEESQHIDPDPAQVVETQAVKKCQGGLTMVSHPDLAETLPMHMEIDLPGLASSSVEDVAALKALDFVPYSIRIKQFFDKWPGSKAPVNLSSSSSRGQECLKIESEPTLPAEKEPGLAEKQARLRKDLKAKAKEDERQKQDKKIQKQLAAEEKKRKKAEPKRRSRKASAAPAAEEPVVAAEPKRRSRKAAAAPDAEAEHPVNPVAAAEPKRKSRKQAAPAAEAETEADHLVNLVVAAEPKRKSRKRDAPPVPASAAAEEAEANDVDSSLDAASFVAVAEDLKTEKVRKAFGLLMASNIPALEVPLAGRKSYTVKPKPGAPPFARPIGVVLYSSSFYVGKVALPQDSWPEECRKFYKVDVKNGVTIPWYKASSPVESQLNKIRTAWKHAMVLGGWIDP
ncbi:unnamed protein product, partial [Durusdinium trenchii]